MSKYGETERFIIELFEESKEFVFDGEKLKILKIGKPRSAKGECKTDVYILTLNDKSEEKEIKISIKQSDADFLENKMSLKRATEIFGLQTKEILLKTIDSVKDDFYADFLVYFSRYKRTEEKCIKIGWKFEFINKNGGLRSGKIQLDDNQKIDIYSGSNLGEDKKNSNVNGEKIDNSGVANYILEVGDTTNDLDYYIGNILPIEDYAVKQEIYFACKAVNYRVQANKWDGPRSLSVYINWSLVDGKLKAEFVMDKPLEVNGNEVGFNIQKILKELKIESNNFIELEDYLGENILFNK
jgi:hypothetical protein